jgi:hypothetical protein
VEGRITYIGSGCEGEGVEAASTAEEADGECPSWPQDRGYSRISTSQSPSMAI